MRGWLGGIERLVSFREALERAVGKPVDVVRTPGTLAARSRASEVFQREVDRDRRLIYARA